MAFQFDEIKKQNWISVLFALEYITDVLAKFLNDEFIKLHAKILSDLNNYKKCTSSCSKTKTTNSWCRTCTNWRNAILNTHQEQFERICKKINWKNVDSLEWPSNYKEVAKCFNPDMSTTKEDDISVIIGRVINCREIRNLFHITLPSACPVDPMKIREIRNTVYHGRNELSSAEKLEYFNTLMAFLQTPCLWKYPDAQEAMKKIQIFKTNNYRDIIKENVIDEHELKRMEKRISQNWRRCYNISIASIILVFVLLVLPLILLVIQEVSNRLCVSVESFLFGSLPEKVDLPNKSGFYNNISTTTLLVLVVVLLVPLVIFSFKELKTTRYFVFLETFMEQMYMKAAWPWRAKDKGLTFVKRREWGADDANNVEEMPTPVGNVFIHHTGGRMYEDEEGCRGRVKYIQFMHMEGNKWDDIGYNFLIGEDGRVYECRVWTTVGAHTFGWNRNSICFAFIGDFNERAPNQRAIRALENVLKWGVENNKLSQNYTLYGHCDKRSTDSPGRYLYAIIRFFDHFHKYIDQ